MNIVLKFFYYAYLLRYRACATTLECRSKDNLRESVFSSSTVWLPGMEAKLSGLEVKCLHQLGHLASPCAYGSGAPLYIYRGDHPEVEELINNGVNECKV